MKSIKLEIIKILENAQQADYKKGGVSIDPSNYEAIANSIATLFATTATSFMAKNPEPQTPNPVEFRHLDLVLRMCNIDLNKDVIATIIDLIPLLMQKGGDVSMIDVINLQIKWAKENETQPNPNHIPKRSKFDERMAAEAAKKK